METHVQTRMMTVDNFFPISILDKMNMWQITLTHTVTCFYVAFFPPGMLLEIINSFSKGGFLSKEIVSLRNHLPVHVHVDANQQCALNLHKPQYF